MAKGKLVMTLTVKPFFQRHVVLLYIMIKLGVSKNMCFTYKVSSC